MYSSLGTSDPRHQLEVGYLSADKQLSEDVQTLPLSRGGPTGFWCVKGLGLKFMPLRAMLGRCIAPGGWTRRSRCGEAPVISTGPSTSTERPWILCCAPIEANPLREPSLPRLSRPTALGGPISSISTATRQAIGHCAYCGKKIQPGRSWYAVAGISTTSLSRTTERSSNAARRCFRSSPSARQRSRSQASNSRIAFVSASSHLERTIRAGTRGGAAGQSRHDRDTQGRESESAQAEKLDDPSLGPNRRTGNVAYLFGESSSRQ
jgi:hypothetical protein